MTHTAHDDSAGIDETLLPESRSIDDRPRSRDEAVPARLGHYVLLHELGKGGMGIVHAAYDEALDRKVALKLLRARDSGEAQQRLVREARALARLSHPNVVQVYEIIEADDRAVLVMEYVDGVTLREWLKSRPRSIAEVLAVFLAAGRGLAAAHAANLVHRDFKPENVMIRRDDRVLVMDFGLARGELGSTHEPRSEPSTPSPEADVALTISEGWTVPGSLLGTPHYMAPEQFRGDPADASSDQFGFCVALWEALFGERPFQADNLVALSLAVVEGRLSEPTRGDVPAWLRRVIERGLARDPGMRWPSMLDLLAALQADPTRRRRAALFGTLTGLTAVLVLGAAHVERERERDEAIAECERESQAIEADWNAEIEAALATSFAATGVGFADSAWQVTRPRMAAYAREWTTLRHAACLDARVETTRDASSYATIAECLDQRRATFAGLVEAWSDTSSATITLAPKAAASLQPLASCLDGTWQAQRVTPPEHARERVATLRARLERSVALEWLGQYQAALDVAEAVRVEAEALAWPPLRGEVRLQIASLQVELGRNELATSSARQAFGEALASGHDMLAFDAATQLLAIGSRQADYEGAELWAAIAERLIERLGLADSVHEAWLHDQLGVLRKQRGDYASALEHHREALRINQAALGPEHIAVAVSLDNLGSVLAKLDQREAALEHHRAALHIRELVLGGTHPHVARSLNNIATVLARHDDTRALVAQQQALDILIAALGPDHPDVGSALTNIGTTHNRLGDPEAALVALRRALAIFVRSLGPDHPNVGFTLNNMGAALSSLGETGDALEHYRRTVEIFEATLGPEHPDLSPPLANIGNMLVREGDYAEALRVYERALAIRERALGPDHPALAYSLTGRGRALLELGRIAEARVALERALGLRERADVGAEELAETRFALARVRWSEGEREAARTLALTARAGYRAMARPDREELSRIDAWLAVH
ncbi:tetratricopeptide repeat protein [Nannocystaceae bacterium ST9]